jgi:Alkylmercury lyase
MVASPGDAVTLDREVRRAVYRIVIADGVPPTVPDVAAELGLTTADVDASLQRLADAHVFVLKPGTSSIWMAAPFSAVPTPFEVTAGDRTYFANCIWDALGIPACLHADGRIDTSCPDCAEPMRLEVRDGVLQEPAEGVIHFAVPAGKWWEDIGAT